jgi:hypothetical protein
MATERAHGVMGGHAIHVPWWAWAACGVAAAGWILWVRVMVRDLKDDTRDGDE